MLVLSRKTNEAIVITASNGERITVTPVEIRGSGNIGVVRLAFTAPDEVRIDREHIDKLRRGIQ